MSETSGWRFGITTKAVQLLVRCITSENNDGRKKTEKGLKRGSSDGFSNIKSEQMNKQQKKLQLSSVEQTYSKF